jgi:hypothetical protein
MCSGSMAIADAVLLGNEGVVAFEALLFQEGLEERKSRGQLSG